MRVLLVDDLAGLRHMVRASLEATNVFTVVGEAKSSRDAVDKARALKPELVLLDLSMPTINGIEALPLLLQASPRSKVVCLTNPESERMSPDAMQRGAIACLEKEKPPKDLVADLVEVLRLH
jgi:DNA-binding NarL/FixJ family response regulator